MTTSQQPQTRSPRRRHVLMGLLAVTALVVIVLSLARDQSWDLRPENVHTQAEATPPATIAVPVQPDALPQQPAAPVAKRPHDRAPKAATEKPKQTRAATTAAKSPEPELTKPAAPVTTAATAPVPAASTTASAAPAVASDGAVTITGCLETTVAEDRFRLTDTEGTDAPKSRGWRSAFLKKQPAPVELVEPTDRQALLKYVGRRVAATGRLTNRELRVRSFEPAGASCS